MPEHTQPLPDVNSGIRYFLSSGTAFVLNRSTGVQSVYRAGAPSYILAEKMIRSNSDMSFFVTYGIRFPCGEYIIESTATNTCNMYHNSNPNNLILQTLPSMFDDICNCLLSGNGAEKVIEKMKLIITSPGITQVMLRLGGELYAGTEGTEVRMNGESGRVYYISHNGTVSYKSTRVCVVLYHDLSRMVSEDTTEVDVSVLSKFIALKNDSDFLLRDTVFKRQIDRIDAGE